VEEARNALAEARAEQASAEAVAASAAAAAAAQQQQQPGGKEKPAARQSRPSVPRLSAAARRSTQGGAGARRSGGGSSESPDARRHRRASDDEEEGGTAAPSLRRQLHAARASLEALQRCALHACSCASVPVRVLWPFPLRLRSRRFMRAFRTHTEAVDAAAAARAEAERAAWRMQARRHCLCCGVLTALLCFVLCR
jgi:hypothetical protein